MKSRPSISSRLFLLLFVSGLAALLLGGSGLYVEVRKLILENLDQTLRSDLEIFTGLIHIEEGKVDIEYTEAPTDRFSIPRSGHYYQILMDGKTLASSVSLAGAGFALLPEEMIQQDEAAGLTVFETSGPAGEPLRAMVKSFYLAGHLTQIRIGHSLQDSYQILQSLRNFLLLFGLVGTLSSALLGWGITRRSMRPLREFSSQVNRIGESTLDQRMDPENQYRELSSLALAFNGMLERLQKSLQAREALLSDVSHELKTPVTVIRSHCDIYLQKDRPANEYVEALEVIRETADSMGQKIRRLLGFAQTEAELISGTGFQLLSLNDCLRKARLTVEPLARAVEIELIERVPADLWVRGHAERIIEAFSNLIENAIKYNRRGGSVIISAEGKQDRVRVQVEDSGCGISPQDLEHIFDRFYRGQGSSLTEGAGLGLVLVKTIIEAHHGQVEVHSRPGAGSCFRVDLPLAHHTETTD